MCTCKIENILVCFTCSSLTVRYECITYDALDFKSYLHVKLGVMIINLVSYGK